MPNRDDDIDIDTNNYPDRSDEGDVLSKKPYREGKYGKIYSENKEEIICPDCGQHVETGKGNALPLAMSEEEWFTGDR